MKAEVNWISSKMSMSLILYSYLDPDCLGVADILYWHQRELFSQDSHKIPQPHMKWDHGRSN